MGPDEIKHLGQKKKNQKTALLSLSQKANKKRKCKEVSVYLKKAELLKKNFKLEETQVQKLPCVS